jgi:hypothetical protein
MAGVSAGPSDFAKLYVAAWLRAGKGTEDVLAVYFPGAVTLNESWRGPGSRHTPPR